jgi:REP element-mobilizing transposase RayT
MSKPARPTDSRISVERSRTFFVTTRTAGGRSLFQTNQMAELFSEVLRSYVAAGEFTVHDFVIMPNHVHLLVTIPGSLRIERAMQLVKGNFSFRANKEVGFKGEIGAKAPPFSFCFYGTTEVVPFRVICSATSPSIDHKICFRFSGVYGASSHASVGATDLLSFRDSCSVGSILARL